MVGLRTPLRGKVSATKVQHITRARRRPAPLEWKIETRVKRAPPLPRTIRRKNVEAIVRTARLGVGVVRQERRESGADAARQQSSG
jgi:hypothetical protein